MQKSRASLLASFSQRISWRSAASIFVILLFLGALCWAKGQDPFVRRWFNVKTESGESFDCAAVLPKPLHRCPVIIYAHGSGGNLMDDGADLRRMAELGLATVSLEYDQRNEAAFGPAFEAVLDYMDGQRWVNTNAIAWVGFGLGANRMWDFALRHPNQQPQLLVQLSGAGLGPSNFDRNSVTNLHCAVLLIHGDQDDIFPVENTRRLSSVLQSNGVPVDSKIIADEPDDMGPDREVVFRCIGEYCLTHLSGANAWQNYRSIFEWEQEAPPFWLFCIPAGVWALGCFACSQHRKPAAREKLKLKRYEIALRCVAAILAIWALSVTAVHLVPPHLAVTDKTLAIARRYLVPPNERTDFEFLASQPIWHGVKLQTLLTHAELAHYNRELINWRLDETNYQKYVLSPVITGEPNERFDWRRPLWEEFYPRIRHENSPADAAVIVVRHLRERVTIANIPNPPREVPAIWLRQITDETGFQIIYVAALRSIGVPAKLDQHGTAKILMDGRWQTADYEKISSRL
jgi:hypothetical protein